MSCFKKSKLQIFLYLLLSLTQTWADEGLFRISNRTLSPFFLNELSQSTGLNTQQTTALPQHIIHAAEATFQIHCPHSKGTGFFVSEQGHFVSAAHVIDQNQKNCSILWYHFEAQQLVAHWQPVELTVLAHRSTLYRWDISYGIVENFKPRQFLKISNTPAQSKQKIFSIGFAQLFDRKQFQTSNQRAEHWIDIIGQPFCNHLEPVSNSYYPQEEKPYSALIQAACAVASLAQHQLPQASWYMLEKYQKNELYLSAGKIFWRDDFKMLSNLDGVAGMSGGPVLDANTGLVLGFNQAVLFSKHVDQIFYSGALIHQTLHPSSIDWLW